MIDHEWRKGERVVSLLYGGKNPGKPSRIIGYGYSYGYGEAKTYLKLETEDTKEVFYAPIISLQSLEERPEEGYYPAENLTLRKSCRELFDSDGQLISEKEVSIY